MNITLRNQDPESLEIEFWQAAYLAVENYLSGPPQPNGRRYGIDYELEVNDGKEIKLRIWSEQPNEIHIEMFPLEREMPLWTLEEAMSA